MQPDEAYDLLREAIPRRPELRYKNWPHDLAFAWAKEPPEFVKDNPYLGFCYIATQVFCHLVPDAQPYCTNDRMHFWSKIGEEVFDPTFDQFKYEFPYHEGRTTKFQKLSARAEALLEECLKDRT